MNNLLRNIPHLIMACVVIVAVSVLALHGTISGAEALAVIGTSGGFSLGAGSASASASGAAASTLAASHSNGPNASNSTTTTIETTPTVPPTV